MLSDMSVNLCAQLIPIKKVALTFPQKPSLLNLMKTPKNLSTILRYQRFPIWVSCLSQSFELDPETVNDSLVEEQEDEEEVNMYTANYLMKSYGLTNRKAISVSKNLTSRNRKFAKTVLAIFRAHGFSDDQRFEIVKKCPLLLRSDPENTLLPKLEFFKSIGFKIGPAYLGKLISKRPTLLARSLDNQLVPNYKILLEVLGSKELVYKAVWKDSRIMLSDLLKILIPNLEVLREAGVTQSKINFLLLHRPSLMLGNHGQFKEAVIRVKEMGCDPTFVNFFNALEIFSGKRRKVVWDQRYKTFMRLGLSNEQILVAFKKYPYILTISEKKICTVMDYLVNKMGWTASNLFEHPRVFTVNMENEIIPRCSVVRLLRSKGLLKTLPKLHGLLNVSQATFFKRYVIRYADEAPEVMQLYKGKSDIPILRYVIRYADEGPEVMQLCKGKSDIPILVSHPLSVNDSLIEEEKDEDKLFLYTVNYLMRSCGLSKRNAISVSKKLTLKNWTLADSILAIFRAHGFSDDQISKIVKTCPSLLKSNPENTLLPKLKMFKSFGFKMDPSALGKLISKQPTLLARSLDNQLEPNFKILMEVLGSNELVYKAVWKDPRILLSDLPQTLIPKVEVFREEGVPRMKINYLLARHPSVMLINHDQFREAVILVKEMGFDHTDGTYFDALEIFSKSRKKMAWDQRFKTYLRLGSTSEQIRYAFKKYPYIMTISEKKIYRVMDYLVNKMGWPASDLFEQPRIFKFKMENRIIPRWSVVQFLHSKGLIKTLPKLTTVLEASYDYFFKRYVIKYADEVPEVLQLYKGKSDFRHN